MIVDKAIFLHKVKYGDSGVIVKLFTKQNGIQSFLLQGLKGKNKAFAAMLHPLAILELSYSEKSRGSLKRIKEVSLLEPLLNIRTDIQHSSIAYFLSEILIQSIHEQEKHTDLFQFLKASIEVLDHSKKVANFHLIFMVRLARFLGFSPLGTYSGKEFFDLREGLFTRLRPVHLDYLEQGDSRRLSEFIEHGYHQMDTELTRTERQFLLAKLIRFYQIHIEGFKNLKSLSVLQELND